MWPPLPRTRMVEAVEEEGVCGGDACAVRDKQRTKKTAGRKRRRMT
jgi:hypothetical protein